MNNAKQALSRLAEILDKQQRLHLQRHKTKFMGKQEFKAYCSGMIEDRPISDDEDSLLKIIRRYSGGSPYVSISFEQISDADWSALDGRLISNIIQDYVSQPEIDFIRLRWFYRRLAQIGHPGAIEISLRYLDLLAPCLASICLYVSSIQTVEPAKWIEVGKQLLEFLQNEEVVNSEYFRLSILSLFSRIVHINHFNQLSVSYSGSDPFAKREILLAARVNGAIDWLREYKEGFEAMDPWCKMAFIYCCKNFPADERKYFLNRWTFDRPFLQALVKWAR